MPVGNKHGSLQASADASNSSTPQLTSQSSSRESSIRTTSPHLVQSPVSSSRALKRKLELYVDIPLSPVQRTSPATTPNLSSPRVRRLSKPIVEIPLSPSHVPTNNSRNGMTGSPLSAKAFNLNTPAPTEPPAKKSKLNVDSNSKAESETFRCHQCGAKCEPNALVVCKAITKSRRNCGIRFCGKCLQRRYNESLDSAQTSSTPWSCPKCRDICNCSRCMRIRGFEPVGVLNGINAQSFVKKPLEADFEKQRSQARPAPTATPSRNLQTSKGKAKGQSTSKLPVAKKSKRALREFILRFSNLMPKIQAHHLESLDEFRTLSQATAAIIILELVDLIALETQDEQEQEVLRAAHDKLISAGSLPAAIWAILKEMQLSLNEKDIHGMLRLPDPSPIPTNEEDEDEETEIPAAPRTRRTARKEVLELDNGVKHAVQLMPPIIALCERAMQGPSIRAEIEEGGNDRKGENRAYYAEVKKENDRWAKNRKKFGVEEDEADDNTPAGSNDNDKQRKRGIRWSKIKDVAGYKAALAEHRTKIANIENAHLLELQGQTPRFGPLGRDSQGRVYYACSARRRSKDRRSPGKAPDADVREKMEKWGWFLAVWGPGGSDSSMPASYGDEEEDEKEERWWGFADPAEIRQLAKWLSSVEGLDEKPALALKKASVASPVKRKLNRANMSGLNLGPPTRKHLTALVKGLNEYADLLAWRIGD